MTPSPPSAQQSLGNGRYELCEFIGKGGMGAVYRARDTELDRSVAVKCLLDVARKGSRELAVKEARTLASLSHPNIMRVYDIMTLGEQVWIVSEWQEGRSLAQLPLPLPPGCIAAIMTQVYDALAAAHAAQVIHRDIKPSNVMVRNDGRVTLIDFGVAFAPGSSTGETLAGSLRYTDPRILEGQTPDALSDLFSAALLQVELMTGETVLPDIAPLPLYRHIKRNLDHRLDDLLDGAYPPLVNLARRFTAVGRGAPALDAAPTTAREAAVLTLDALRRLTQKTPEQYLEGGLCRGAIVDPVAERVIAAETAAALASSLLTPKQKAAWIAFKAAGEAGSAPRPARAAERPNDGRTAPISLRRTWPVASQTWALSGAALAILVLVATALWMFLTSPPTLVGPPATVAATTNKAGADPLPQAPPAKPAPSLSVAAAQGEKAAPVAWEHAGGEASAAKALPPAPPPPVPIHLVADAWAQVFIDGKEVGRLPQAAPFLMAPGRHVLRLVNPAVEPLNTEIVVEPDRAARLRFTLPPKTAPRIIKLAQPGRLFIDGKDQGIVSSKRVRLRYGTHQIWVTRGGRTGKPLNVALAPDSPAEIKVE